MKKKLMIGLFSMFVVGLIAVGIVYAHEGNYAGYMMGGVADGDYFNMHDEVDMVLESGTFEDLQNLREEYSMPIMYWIDSEEDFQYAKDMHNNVGNSRYLGRVSGMPCHGGY